MTDDQAHNPCPELQELFVAYVDGRFGETEQVLRSHAASCERCRASGIDIYDLLATWGHLGQMAPVELSGNYYARLHSKLEAATLRHKRAEKLWRWTDLLFEWGKLPALAGLLYLIFTLQIYPDPQAWHGKGPQRTAHSPAAKISVQQILQRSVPEMMTEMAAACRAYFRQKNHLKNEQSNEQRSQG